MVMSELGINTLAIDVAKAAIQAELRNLSEMDSRVGVQLSRNVEKHRAFLKGAMSVLKPDIDQDTTDFIDGAQAAHKFVNGEENALTEAIARLRF